MFASVNCFTAVAIASESVGLRITTPVSEAAALASWLAWVAESSDASWKLMVSPSSSAFFWALSRICTKKGLAWVDSAKVIDLAEALPVVLLLPAAFVLPDSRLHAVRLVQSKVAEATAASVLRSLVLNITGGTLSEREAYSGVLLGSDHMGRW